MFTTYSELKLPIQPGERGRSFWSAVELGIHSTWFIATFTHPHADFCVTFLLGSDAEVNQFLREGSLGEMVSLSMAVPPSDAGGNWQTLTVVKVERVNRESDDDDVPPLIFTTSDGVRRAGYFGEPFIGTQMGKELASF